jgi:hypothetical protein
MAATNKSKNAAKKKTAPKKVEPEIEPSEWRQHYGNSMADGFGLITAFVIMGGIYKLGALVVNQLSSPKAEAED